MNAYVIKFAKYLVGLRAPWSSLGTIEHDLIGRLAEGKQCVVEVGVFEGVTSRVLCEKIDRSGRLYLVDPYYRSTKFETLLSLSFSEFIARRNVKAWKNQVEFIRSTSLEAAERLAPTLASKIDFVFIDAQHEYQRVLEDFQCWSALLAPNGILALDDTNDATWGPGLLCSEIDRGKHGDWQIFEKAGQVTAIKRNQVAY